MKKARVFSLFLSLIILATALASPAASALQTVAYPLSKDTTISAQSAMVIHLGSSAQKDMVIYSKGADTPLSPAGMVRIMAGITAMTILEEKKLDMDTATGSYTEACYNVIAGTGIPTAGMEYGDTWTIRDLLTITMIHSAADVAEALAFSLAGSEAAFVKRMNELAASKAGCTNTTFKNMNGNDDDKGQVTTAMDMYRILRCAMEYPDLQAMLSLSYYDVKPKKGEDITLPSTNNLLRVSTDSYYEPALFGRAGWSDISGPGVAAVARDNGYEYMVVVMGSSKKTDNSHFTDAKALFRWAFRDFSLTTVRTKNDPIADIKVRLSWDADHVQLVPKEDYTAIIPDTLDVAALTVKPSDIPKTVNAPVEKGQAYGKAALYTPDGQKIGEIELVADQSLSRSQWLFVWYNIGRFFTSWWFWGGFLLLLALAGGYAVLTIRYNRQRRSQNQQKIKPYK